MASTRFHGQILYSGTQSKWFRDQPQSSSPNHVMFMEDFIGAAIDSTNDWTVIKDASAAVAIVADAENGELTLTSAATTDNDGAAILKQGAFLPAAGRTIWFEARVKLSDAIQQDLFVGLTKRFTTNPENVLTVTDRVGLQIDDDATNILCKSIVASAASSTDSGVVAVTATYVRLGFIINGISSIEYFVDRQRVATIQAAVPVVPMLPVVFSLSGNATGTKVTTVDYVTCIATR